MCKYVKRLTLGDLFLFMVWYAFTICMVCYVTFQPEYDSDYWLRVFILLYVYLIISLILLCGFYGELTRPELIEAQQKRTAIEQEQAQAYYYRRTAVNIRRERDSSSSSV